MTNKEKINRNIGLTFDFLRQIVSNPTLLKQVSNGTQLEFVDKDFSKSEQRFKKRTSRRKYLRAKTHLEVI
jgi:hypothetical protein